MATLPWPFLAGATLLDHGGRRRFYPDLLSSGAKFGLGLASLGALLAQSAGFAPFAGLLLPAAKALRERQYLAADPVHHCKP